MRAYSKIVLAGINITCLLITLLFPNSATPISLLPVVVTSASWVFFSRGRDLLDSENQTRRNYLICATVISVFCIVTGMTCIISVDVNKNYVMTFREEVALLGSKSFEYGWFSITVFIAIVILIITEVIATFREKSSDSASRDMTSMHSLVLTTFRMADSGSIYSDDE